MNVIIYVMDSLRPDFLSCYGYKNQTSPNIDRFSKQSVIFRNAFTVSTWTRPTAAAILTGMYPEALGMENMNDYFYANVPRLPEILKSEGFKTISISAMTNVSSEFGFSRGFDEFVDLYKEVQPNVKAKLGKMIKIPTSQDINEFAFSFLRKLVKDKFFMFIWSIDTHAPYFIRGSNDKFNKPAYQKILFNEDIAKMKSAEQINELKKIYEKMIYYNDFNLGKLIRELVSLNIYDETMVVFTADHGEAFMEHGFNGHGGPPYEEQIRVPLIIKLPFNKFSKEQRSSIVQLVDICPTIISRLGLRKLDSLISGKDLSRVIERDESVNDFAYFAGLPDSMNRRNLSLRTGQWKYITYGYPDLSMKTLKSGPKRFKKFIIKSESMGKFLINIPRTFYKLIRKFICKDDMFFDLKNDPMEKCNLLKSRRDLLGSLKKILAEVQRKNKKIKNEVLPAYNHKESEEIKNHLRALGYYE